MTVVHILREGDYIGAPKTRHPFAHGTRNHVQLLGLTMNRSIWVEVIRGRDRHITAGQMHNNIGRRVHCNSIWSGAGGQQRVNPAGNHLMGHANWNGGEILMTHVGCGKGIANCQATLGEKMAWVGRKYYLHKQGARMTLLWHRC